TRLERLERRERRQKPANTHTEGDDERPDDVVVAEKDKEKDKDSSRGAGQGGSEQATSKRLVRRV
ncbi:MAG TPA: hypothetical protein VK754_07095, partial [Propionibacteriaceae bacterium]|nr:hypothetical protein [Propionibacteriaceae bacterium]